MAATKAMIPLLVLCLSHLTKGQEISIFKSIRECLRENSTALCLKERALKIVDEAVTSDQPIPVNDYIDIVRDSSYQVNLTAEEDLPRDLKERSESLTQLLIKRVDDFFESRSMKFKMAKIMQGIYKFIYSEIEAFYEGTVSLNLHNTMYSDVIGPYNDYLFDVSKIITNFIPNCMVPPKMKGKSKVYT